MKKLSVVLFVLLAVACGSDESTPDSVDAGVDTDPGWRPELDVALPDVGTDDTGTITPRVDAGSDADEPDTNDPCAGGCTTGLTRCSGSDVQYCVADANRPGCGVWEPAAPCASPQQTCIGNRCDFPTDCVDNDNDGYGVNCAAGPDCNDADRNVHPGMAEQCDGIDNDCDTDVDETFNVGGTCSIGTGVCATPGVFACSGTGQVTCMATGTPGQPERCDGIDNDCDNQVDEGGVCDVCSSDPNEPNNTLLTATALTLNAAKYGFSCPADEDFFALPTSPNKTYRVNLNFPNALSNIDLELLANGTVAQTAASTNDREVIQFTSSPNTSYAVRVLNPGNAFNIYRLAMIDGIPCQFEDSFYPNTTRTSAAYLLSNWRIEGHVCDAGAPKLSDWYYVGELTPTQAVDVYLFEVDNIGDLDLFVWADPDGNGVYDVVRSSLSPGTDELTRYTASATTRVYVEVRDYAGIGAFYELMAERN